ncbi:MYB-like transcription factor family protein [Medicago truncatula]|uniref:MYB-like transcription factor family protein n=1 Tax=Medicago truncatula TaxID=3880 RepID=A0A072VIR9_MEDTR|nr:MYB-like transcription factor family protein [Medicago truncatula]
MNQRKPPAPEVKPWTRTEHKAFLKGLKAVGKGKWKRISKDFVVTKTPTQVASHAQKHFNYRRGTYNNKNRTSVFDMKLEENENSKATGASSV